MKNHPIIIIGGVIVNLHPTQEATNFDYRVAKSEAERLLKQHGYQLPFEIMCKEYGEDTDWVGVTPADLDDTEKLHETYQTFETWYYLVTPLNQKS